MIIIIFGNKQPGLARAEAFFETLAQHVEDIEVKAASIVEGTPAVLEIIERIALAAGCNVIKPTETVDNRQGEYHAYPN